MGGHAVHNESMFSLNTNSQSFFVCRKLGIRLPIFKKRQLWQRTFHDLNRYHVGWCTSHPVFGNDSIAGVRCRDDVLESHDLFFFRDAVGSNFTLTNYKNSPDRTRQIEYLRKMGIFA